MRIGGDLRSALDAIGEPILLVAADSQIRHRNRRATRLAALAARTHLVRPDEQAAPDVLRFLARCCRSGRHLNGSISLPATSEAGAIDLRCQGSRMRLEPGASPLVLLRLLPLDEIRPLAADGDRLQQLLHRARLDERTRIARDLHDQAGQQVLSLKLGLSRLRRTSTHAAQTGAIDGLIGQADVLVADLQRAIADLRPPVLVEFGLGGALRDLAERWSLANGVPIDFHVLGVPETLAAQAGAALFRLLQEALTNVAKHATGVSAVSIRLRYASGRASLTIRDDGVGLPNGSGAPTALVQRGQFGLVGMRERIAHLGGALELRSTGGHRQGTTIVAQIHTESQDQGGSHVVGGNRHPHRARR